MVQFEKMNNIEYLLSRNVLGSLREMDLISEKEFEAIDIENKKSFQPVDYQGFNLIL
ncbi:MAG TPA: hypothetical protein GX707_17355 [Epulopiscium sp.]|nr:hypothetical protein [Candidatus Epulonipiscium sp.]